MRGYVGNTDFDWYSFLGARPDIGEVNFWQPSGGRGFHVVPVGAPFFFRLKKPHYAIAGFGVFAGHSVLPVSLAWECFGEQNGAPSLREMRRRVERYRRIEDRREDYKVGCLMVVNPIFFPAERWVREPTDWAKNIVQGKGYDLRAGEGARIYDACLSRARPPLQPPSVELPRYGEGTWVRPRLNQGTFRVAVTDAYGRACAITSEHSLPVLEAAHIRPFSDNGPHDVTNGLLLRSDIHKLFDRGYVTVTASGHFEVSRRLREDWENGVIYYERHGQRIAEPDNPMLVPDSRNLEWHNEHVYLG